MAEKPAVMGGIGRIVRDLTVRSVGALDQVKVLNRMTVFVFCLAVVAWGFCAACWLGADPRHTLRTVLVQGEGDRELIHVDPVMARTVSLPEISGNFFTVELSEIRRAFEVLPWVRGASVRRSWPNKLVVTIEEYEPLGTWGGGEQLMSTKGDVFAGTLAESGLKEPFPKFSGPEGSGQQVFEQYKVFCEKFARLGKTVSEVSLSEQGLWTVVFAGGPKVSLGRGGQEKIMERVDTFISVYPQLVARSGAEPLSVDMRYENGVAVRRKSSAPAEEQQQT